MHINYFGYYVEHKQTKNKYLTDLSPLLAHFASPKMLQFRKNVQYNGDSVFPLPFVSPTYYFVQSRDNEIIKAINKQGLTQKDISAVIGSNESVAFASYIHMRDCWLGIATKVLSPRVTAFCHAFNSLLDKIQAPYEFKIQAFTDQIKASQVTTLDHVGAVSIEIDAGKGVGKDLLDALTGNGTPNLINVGQIEVRIVPSTRKANLKPVLKDLINKVPAQQLHSLDARARVNAADHMKDVFIIGAGGLRDTLSVKKESQIPQTIALMSSNNATLNSKIVEFLNAPGFRKASSPASIGITW